MLDIIGGVLCRKVESVRKTLGWGQGDVDSATVDGMGHQIERVGYATVAGVLLAIRT
jgi:hypothetical protein